MHPRLESERLSALNNVRAFFAFWILVTNLQGCNRSPPVSESAEASSAVAGHDFQIAPQPHGRGASAARAYARANGLTSLQSRANEAVVPAVRTVVHKDYDELDWSEMIPPGTHDPIEPAPVIRHSGHSRMAQIGSFETVPALFGRKVRLRGFVVPIETNDRGELLEFFFVPYFGACIHVPPPPPNQLVHVVLSKPVRVPQLWDPFWLRGELTPDIVRNNVAGSAYSLSDAVLLPFQS